MSIGPRILPTYPLTCGFNINFYVVNLARSSLGAIKYFGCFQIFKWPSVGPSIKIYVVNLARSSLGAITLGAFKSNNGPQPRLILILFIGVCWARYV
jgi:hypothetical protein